MGSSSSPLQQGLSAGSSILGGLLGGFTGNNQLDWYKSALMTVLQNMQQTQGFGEQYGQQNFNPASSAAQGLLDRAPQLLFGNSDGSTPGDLTNLSSYLQQAFGGINPSTFQQSGLTAGGQGALQGMGGTAASLSNPMSLLSNVIGNGGGSAQSQQIWNALQGLAGGNTPGMQNLQASGVNLLQNPQNPMTNTATQQAINSIGQGGMTNGLNFAQNAAQFMANSGGSNANMNQGMQTALGLLGGQSPYISNLAQAGMGGLQSNLGVAGLTNTGAQGESAALGGIQNQGATQDSNFFEKAGQSLTQPAVLPTLMATSMARDQATGNMEQAAEGARAQALARGGGPGSVVANGATNQGLADFADQGARGISNAVENSLIQQQGLGLQQQQQGAQMGLQGGQLQLGNLSNASGLLNGLENTATNRFGVSGGLLGNAQGLSSNMTGQGLSGVQGLSGLQSQNVLSALGMMPGIANSAAGQANTFGNLGLGTGQLNLQNLAQGGNFLQQYNNGIMGGNQGLQGNLNQANNYTLGASGALQGLGGTQGSILNNILGGNLSGSQLGMNQASNYYGALQGLISGQQGMVNTDMGMYNPAMSTLTDIGRSAFGLAGQGTSGIAGLFGNYNPNNNPMGQGLSSASAGLPGLLSAIFHING
jgi:hypothetical protein